MKSNATFNPVLTALFNEFFVNPSGFVGLQIAPIFRTGEQSSTYTVFPRGNLVNVPELKRRAPGTPFQRSTGEISDDNYSCKNYGHETPLADEVRRKYAKQIDAERAALRRNAHTILVNHEVRVHAIYNGNGIQNSSPAKKWDDYADADSNPIADVKAAKEVIRLECGQSPNTLTLSQPVVDKLSLHPKVRGLFPTYNGPLTVDMLRIAFEIQRVLIAGTVVNNAAEGAAVDLADLWGDVAILSISNDTQDLEVPNAARTFLWEAPGESGGGEVGSYVEQYRDDTIKSDVFRSLHHTDEKLTGEGMAYRLYNVLT
jgi:hypothetical protein